MPLYGHHRAIQLPETAKAPEYSPEPSGLSPCTAIGVPACTVRQSYPDYHCASNIPGVRGQRPRVNRSRDRKGASIIPTEGRAHFWVAVQPVR